LNPSSGTYRNDATTVFPARSCLGAAPWANSNRNLQTLMSAEADTEPWPQQRLLIFFAVIIFVAMFLQFFRGTIWSGFRLLGGDEGDVALIAYLHEHVYQSLLGHVSLRNPQFYYPTPGVLGYTDTFLLNQIFYAPLRFLGVTSLLATQFTFMLLSLMGSAFFALLLLRFFSVRVWLAIIAAAIFGFGHALYLKSFHPQHFSIYFLPVVGYLALVSLCRAQSKLMIAGLAFCAGLVLGLTFATGYYMAWFFVLFLIFALPMFLLLNWSRFVEFARVNRTRLIIGLASASAGFGVSAILVVWIYLPALSALKSLTAATFLVNAATFRDIINVSDGDLVWGWLLRWSAIIPLNRLQATELHLAVTPLLVIAVTVATIGLLRLQRPSEYESMAATICGSVLVGYLTVCLFTITVHGYSFFLLVRDYIPGGVAIRVGFRSQVLASLFVALAFAVAAEAYLRGAGWLPGWNRLGRPTQALAVLLVAILVILEQIDLMSVARFDRVREDDILASAPPPLAECRVFAIYDDGSRKMEATQIDAMRVSQRFGLPTLNGYSGGEPPGWDLDKVQEPSYFDKVRRWARDKKVAGPLCLYDAMTKGWRPIS
jgi:hypothetical protein